MKVLLVDDDLKFRKFTSIALEEAGYSYEVASNGEEGLEKLQAAAPGTYDLILLDIQMPGSDGWGLLEAIRTSGDETPVVYVTSRDELQDKVKGLRLGADDYVSKPVEYEELIARLEAVVRRRQSLPTVNDGEMCVDLARRKVETGGRPVDLSPREFDLLLALVRAKGEVVSRTTLLREVWDMDFDPETNVVDVHIGRLRKKLDGREGSWIETVRGQGYRMKTVSPS